MNNTKLNKMHQQKSRLLLNLLLTFCFTVQFIVPEQGQARDYLDITAAEMRKIPAAVPYFVNLKNEGRISENDEVMTALMVKGLEFHGFLSVVPVTKYGGGQSADWKGLGVELVVQGKYELSGDSITFEFRLIDTMENGMLLGKRYQGDKADRDGMILKFCDEIIYKLTGDRGISQSKIAFVSDGTGHKEVYVADVLGEKIRQVTRHQFIATSPRFSPDGVKLAYTSYHKGNPDLYITDLRQSKTTRSISYQKGLNIAAAWHPNGGKMAITLSKGETPDLYLITEKGQILERLTNNAGINVSPCWSPNGDKLAFVSDRSGSPQIYVMDLSTRQTKRITFSGNYNTSPSWSPKGDLIVYAGLYEKNYHIFVIPQDGGAPERLTHSWGDNESPSWSPDGKQIVFSRRRGGKSEICAIFLNGSGLRSLFALSGNQTMPQWSSRLNY